MNSRRERELAGRSTMYNRIASSLIMGIRVLQPVRRGDEMRSRSIWLTIADRLNFLFEDVRNRERPGLCTSRLLRGRDLARLRTDTAVVVD